jgi:uncharacterized PurR-regulated membrane protein YhhQ (DUF165 family)
MRVLIGLLAWNVLVIEYSNAVILKELLVFVSVGLHGVLPAYAERQD